MTPSLSSVVQCIDGTFYNFSVTRIVRMIRAKNYEKLCKFVKVTAKILSVSFYGHGVNCRKIICGLATAHARHRHTDRQTEKRSHWSNVYYVAKTQARYAMSVVWLRQHIFLRLLMPLIGNWC